MTKVALFFKKWKNYSRHTKLNDDWTLATSLKDFSEFGEEDADDGTAEFDIFQVKYLGNISTDLPRSEEGTADAIKNIITTAKATNKKLHRLNMSVCPKGIECFDAITGETILKVSIYKISYCSADATHANVFAFVAGSKENLAPSEDDPLTCYAFVCAKRKVAHKLTLTVARNFEQAFKQWQESMQRKKHRNQLEEMTNSQKSKNMDNVCGDSSQLVHDNSYNGISDGHLSQLIDFDSELGESQSAQHSQLLQNSWVSFDDEPVIDESKIEVPTTIYENNMWGQDLLCSP